MEFDFENLLNNFNIVNRDEIKQLFQPEELKRRLLMIQIEEKKREEKKKLISSTINANDELNSDFNNNIKTLKKNNSQQNINNENKSNKNKKNKDNKKNNEKNKNNNNNNKNNETKINNENDKKNKNKNENKNDNKKNNNNDTKINNEKDKNNNNNDIKINKENDKNNNNNIKTIKENNNNNNNNKQTKEKDNIKSSTELKTNSKKSLKIEITSSTSSKPKEIETTEISTSSNSNNTKSFKRSTSLPPEIKNMDQTKHTDSQKQIFNTILPSIPEKFDKTIVIKRNNSNSPNTKNISNKNKNKLLNKKQVNKYHYTIYPGNNGSLIEKVMSIREELWEKNPKEYSKFSDFIWTPLAYEIDFALSNEYSIYVNHLEYNGVISNKLKLFETLLKHCEKKGYDLFNFFPLTLSFRLNSENFHKNVKAFEYIYNNIEMFVKNKENDKNFTFENLGFSFGKKKIGNVQKISIPKSFYAGKNMWIIKPVNFNRGRFIKVENEIEKISTEFEQIKKVHRIKNTQNNSKAKCNSIIIQKYLENALTYQNRKFDIRLWVMFIGNKPNNVYIFKEGHLKATCSEYDVNSKDPYVHLTNYSIQKHNSEFGKIEIGNEIPFKDFQNDLDKKKLNVNFKKDIYPNICKIVRITAGAAYPKINIFNRKNCFEIFGYDFIIDEDFNPYLLEINTNPGLEISSPLIKMLLPRMIDDAFKLTIDKLGNGKMYIKRKSLFSVEGYSDEENMWEKFKVL